MFTICRVCFHGSTWRGNFLRHRQDESERENFLLSRLQGELLTVASNSASRELPAFTRGRSTTEGDVHVPNVQKRRRPVILILSVITLCHNKSTHLLNLRDLFLRKRFPMLVRITQTYNVHRKVCELTRCPRLTDSTVPSKYSSASMTQPSNCWSYHCQSRYPFFFYFGNRYIDAEAIWFFPERWWGMCSAHSLMSEVNVATADFASTCKQPSTVCPLDAFKRPIVVVHRAPAVINDVSCWPGRIIAI